MDLSTFHLLFIIMLWWQKTDKITRLCLMGHQSSTMLPWRFDTWLVNCQPSYEQLCFSVLSSFFSLPLILLFVLHERVWSEKCCNVALTLHWFSNFELHKSVSSHHGGLKSKITLLPAQLSDFVSGSLKALQLLTSYHLSLQSVPGNVRCLVTPMPKSLQQWQFGSVLQRCNLHFYSGVNSVSPSAPLHNNGGYQETDSSGTDRIVESFITVVVIIVSLIANGGRVRLCRPLCALQIYSRV